LLYFYQIERESLQKKGIIPDSLNQRGEPFTGRISSFRNESWTTSCFLQRLRPVEVFEAAVPGGAAT
jgi:hypothetical protein